MTAKFTQNLSGLELLEEAVYLLRHTPTTIWAIYLAGVIPFWVGLLFFLTAMGRSAEAGSLLLPGSLIMVFLFGWMKASQSLFSLNLKDLLLGEELHGFDLRRLRRTLGPAFAVHPWGLLLIPLATLAFVPGAWVYAYFQNYTVMAAEDRGETSLHELALHQTKPWWREHHFALFVMFLLSLFIYLNANISGLLIPQLMKSILGWETLFSNLGPLMLASWTYQSICLAITFLVMDPVLKAFYMLRCFYGRSLSTGEDIQASLNFISRAGRKVLLAVLVGLIGLTAPSELGGLAAQVDAAQPAVAPGELADEIEAVIQRREYTWRMPRDQRSIPDNALDHFIKDMTNFLNDSWNWLLKRVKGFIDWLLGGDQASTGNTGSFSIFGEGRFLTFGFLVLLGFCIFLAYYFFKRKKKKLPIETNITPIAVTDLHSDDVVASALPEDEWWQMGRDLLAQGDRRLALRAFFLSLLAYLGERTLVAIGPAKANREYRAELARRGHAFPNLCESFDRNVILFECAWYGMYDVSESMLNEFEEHRGRIKSSVES